MTIGKREREKNYRTAFEPMMRELGDLAIDTTLFDSEASPFAGTVLRTTWEELVDSEYVSRIAGTQYRLTPKGWLAALELSGAAGSTAYQERIGRVPRMVGKGVRLERVSPLAAVVFGRAKPDRKRIIPELKMMRDELGALRKRLRDAEQKIFFGLRRSGRRPGRMGSGQRGAGARFR
jgi:hypothetical protein